MNDYLKSFLRNRYYKWIENRGVEGKLKILGEDIRHDVDLVLVHQMGRAASMTITNTLRSMNLNQPIYHTHWLNRRSVDDRVRRVRNRRHAGVGPLNVRVAELLAPEIASRLSARQWRVVSVIREPVARNVSAFFLSIDKFFLDFPNRFRKNEISIQKMAEVFLDEYPHDIPLEWFDLEVKEPFGIDVFNMTFDQQKGYLAAEHENVSLLVIKLNKLDECFKDAFASFFGRYPEGLINTHVTQGGETGAVYKEFVERVELPNSYLDSMYDSKYVKHFYTDEEVAAFRKKWSNKC